MREAQGLSLRKLAEIAHTDAAYLSRVERGERTPSERWLRSVTQALGTYMARGAA